MIKLLLFTKIGSCVCCENALFVWTSPLVCGLAWKILAADVLVLVNVNCKLLLNYHIRLYFTVAGLHVACANLCCSLIQCQDYLIITADQCVKPTAFMLYTFRLSIPLFLTQYQCNSSRKLPQILHIRTSLGLRDELIRIWWPKVSMMSCVCCWEGSLRNTWRKFDYIWPALPSLWFDVAIVSHC